jgi:DNA-binding LacI/PurR family transcriptional regulator
VDRVRSYNDFFTAKGHSISKACIEYGNYDWHSGYECTKKFLGGDNPPTAIMAANDLMAIGAMKAIQERGLDVPSDISVMGYDDIDIASLCTPALTTVRQPKYEMGKCSVQSLLNRIEARKTEKNPEPNVTIFNTEIIERNSVSVCKESA